MADTRYLKRQGHSWFFHMTVPKNLRSAFPSEGRRAQGGGRLPGKPREKIVVALSTQSLREAQDRRWPLVHEWREMFKRALSGAPLSLAEIEEQAREVYQSTLERLETEARHRPAQVAQQLEALDQGLRQFAALSGFDDFAVYEGKNLDEHIEGVSDFDFIAHELSAIERRKGIALDPSTDTYKLLGRAIIRATIAAAAGRMKALQGQPSESPASFLGSQGIDPVTLRPIVSLPRPLTRINTGEGGMTFEEAASQYLSELRHDEDAKITEQTLRRTERVFALFKDYSRNRPLSAIDKDTARDFVNKIALLDPNWGNRERADNTSFAKLIETFGQGERHLSNATINKYVHSLSALFSWAERKTNYEGRNPFQGQSRAKPDPKQTGWKAYSTEELKKLFASKPAQITMYWLPLIALFSGMRLGEICQLHTDDVRREQGVWCFHIKRGKTEAAARFVPVHSELERLGLLDYSKALPDGQLWPTLKPGGPDQKLGWNFSAQFTEYRRACGVTGERLTFHSFRKNAAQALKDARATPAEIAELVGHERGFTVETYAPLGLPVKALKELIERVRYPGLRFSRTGRSKEKAR